jgi:hypothetical protein
MTTRIFYRLVVLAALSLLTASSRADSILLSYVGVDAGGQESIKLNGASESGPNGVQTMATRNAVGPLASGLSSHIWAYCYELGQYTDFPYNTYQVVPLASAIGADKAALISQLWAKHYDSSWETQTYIYRGGSYGGYTAGQPASTPENTKALAMVLAIYEIKYDFSGTLGSLNFSAGTFQATGSNPSAAVSTAQSWLSNLLLPKDYHGPMANLVALTNPNLQDLIAASSSVPLPSAAFMGLGLLGTLIGGTTVRQKRRA